MDELDLESLLRTALKLKPRKMSPVRYIYRDRQDAPLFLYNRATDLDSFTNQVVNPPNNLNQRNRRYRYRETERTERTRRFMTTTISINSTTTTAVPVRPRRL